MDYQATVATVCDAEENDWLDISYSQRKYVQKPRKQKRRLKIGTAWKIAAVAVLCVAVLAAMLFIDGDFKAKVFEAVKTASSSIFHKNESTESVIDIPCNLTLMDIDSGIMTFSGGRAALSLTDGTVTAADENSVTVTMADGTAIVYKGLTSSFVKLSDKVSANSLLGKYDGEFTATIMQQGQVVKEVVGSPSQLKWNV